MVSVIWTGVPDAEARMVDAMYERPNGRGGCEVEGEASI